MKTSQHISKYLSTASQAAFNARAEEVPEKEGPVSPNVALLKRVQRIVFSENVSTLEEAASRFKALLESLDDDENQDANK